MEDDQPDIYDRGAKMSILERVRGLGDRCLAKNSVRYSSRIRQD
jgi:hypothetical protein